MTTEEVCQLMADTVQGKDTRKRYPLSTKEAVLSYCNIRRTEDASWAQIGKDIDLTPVTIAKWRKQILGPKEETKKEAKSSKKKSLYNKGATITFGTTTMTFDGSTLVVKGDTARKIFMDAVEAL